MIVLKIFIKLTIKILNIKKSVKVSKNKKKNFIEKMI